MNEKLRIIVLILHGVIMKKPLNLLLPLFLFLGSIVHITFSQDLHIEFSIEKTEYIVEELIVINYRLINTGKTRKELKHNNNIFYDIFRQLNLEDKNGNQLEYNGPFFNYRAKEPPIIKPNEKITTDENPVELLFGYGSLKTNSKLHRTYLPAGEYRLSFKSKLSEEYINSNEIIFTIKEPGEKDGYDKFKQIDSTANDTTKYNKFKDFLFEFPESCYKANIYDEFRTFFWLFKINPEKIFIDLENYIDSNYDSWTIGKYLWSCADTIRKTKGEDEWKNYLLKMINKYPGTRVSQKAYKLLFK